MSTRYGTSYFPSREHAANYYRDYVPRGPGRVTAVCALVNRLIENGEIHVGQPLLRAGQTLNIEDNRYFITEAAQ